MLLWSNEKGAYVDVPDDLVEERYLSGDYRFRKGQLLNVRTADGEYGSVDESLFLDIVSAGGGYDSQQSINRRIDEETYGGAAGAIGSLAAGTASGLMTDAVSESLLSALPGVTKEDIKKVKAFHPGMSLGGQVLGTVAPAVFSGGTSVAAKFGLKGLAKGLGAGAKASKFSVAGISQLAQEAAEKSIMSRIMVKSPEVGKAFLPFHVPNTATTWQKAGAVSQSFMAGNAVDAVVYTSASLIGEEFLGDPSKTAIDMLLDVSLSAALGGGIGAAFGIGSTTLSSFMKVSDEPMLPIFQKFLDSYTAAVHNKDYAAVAQFRDPKFLDEVVYKNVDKVVNEAAESAADLSNRVGKYFDEAVTRVTGANKVKRASESIENASIKNVNTGESDVVGDFGAVLDNLHITYRDALEDIDTLIHTGPAVEAREVLDQLRRQVTESRDGITKMLSELRDDGSGFFHMGLTGQKFLPDEAAFKGARALEVHYTSEFGWLLLNKGEPVDIAKYALGKRLADAPVGKSIRIKDGDQIPEGYKRIKKSRKTKKGYLYQKFEARHDPTQLSPPLLSKRLAKYKKTPDMTEVEIASALKQRKTYAQWAAKVYSHVDTLKINVGKTSFGSNVNIQKSGGLSSKASDLVAWGRLKDHLSQSHLYGKELVEEQKIIDGAFFPMLSAWTGKTGFKGVFGKVEGGEWIGDTESFRKSFNKILKNRGDEDFRLANRSFDALENFVNVVNNITTKEIQDTIGRTVTKESRMALKGGKLNKLNRMFEVSELMGADISRIRGQWSNATKHLNARRELDEMLKTGNSSMDALSTGVFYMGGGVAGALLGQAVNTIFNPAKGIRRRAVINRMRVKASEKLNTSVESVGKKMMGQAREGTAAQQRKRRRYKRVNWQAAISRYVGSKVTELTEAEKENATAKQKEAKLIYKTFKGLQSNAAGTSEKLKSALASLNDAPNIQENLRQQLFANIQYLSNPTNLPLGANVTNDILTGEMSVNFTSSAALTYGSIADTINDPVGSVTDAIMGGRLSSDMVSAFQSCYPQLYGQYCLGVQNYIVGSSSGTASLPPPMVGDRPAQAKEGLVKNLSLKGVLGE